MNMYRFDRLSVLVLLLLLVTQTNARRLCKLDSECKLLGNLVCIKITCELGQCGCETGKVAKYFGQDYKFQCVPLVKIGQSCSAVTPVGICGAPNSYCNSLGYCSCLDGYVSVWNGELCAHSTDAWPTDQAAFGNTNIATCMQETASGFLARMGPSGSGVEATIFEMNVLLYPQSYDGTQALVNTCNCPAGHHTEVLYLNNPAKMTFQLAPVCIKNYVFTGSSGTTSFYCLTDSDCGDTSMTCSSDRCICKTTGQVPDYWGLKCSAPLAFGADCTNNNGTVAKPNVICDGTKGLVCGDMCQFREREIVLTGKPSPPELKCTCGPSHINNNGVCTSRKVGDSCYGDWNCRGLDGLGLNGRCVKGSCVAAAGRLVAAPGLLLAALTLFALRRL